MLMLGLKGPSVVVLRDSIISVSLGDKRLKMVLKKKTFVTHSSLAKSTKLQALSLTLLPALSS